MASKMFGVQVEGSGVGGVVASEGSPTTGGAIVPGVLGMGMGIEVDMVWLLCWAGHSKALLAHMPSRALRLNIEGCGDGCVYYYAKYLDTPLPCEG